MEDSRPRPAKGQGSGGGQVGSGIWGRCCGGGVGGVSDYVPGRPASHGRGMVGRWVRWEPVADKNKTEALQKLRHTHRVLSGAKEEEKQEQTSISRRIFLSLSNSSKEPFKICLFEVSQKGTLGFNTY